MDANPEVAWEGRTWLRLHRGKRENVMHDNQSDSKKDIKERIRVCTYHVCADTKGAITKYSTARQWENRRVRLLQELKTYNADIICLQDVDHFHDWWQPKLAILGYDSVWHKRTTEKSAHSEGLVIAFRRAVFQLFKTVPVELNNASESEANSLLRDRIRSDDVGLILFLQPLAMGYFSTGLCVGSAMFSDRSNDSDVRAIQSKYFLSVIEQANMEFQLPVFLGLSLHDIPSSPAYHIFSTGRTALDAKKPHQPTRPAVEPFGRGAMRLSWFAPPRGKADPDFNSYRIGWCPGGSLELGFSTEEEVFAEDCQQYEDIIDHNGNRKSVLIEELSTVISGLSSGASYEFRIAAINEIGQGEWSELSFPCLLPVWDKMEPMAPKLHYLKNPPAILQLREQLSMTTHDRNTNTMFSGVSGMTNLTPRDVNENPADEPRGRVLPDTINPREGWNPALNGTVSESVLKDVNNDLAMRRSILRNAKGFKKEVSDYRSGKKAKIKYRDDQESDNDSDTSEEEVFLQANGDADDGDDAASNASSQSEHFELDLYGDNEAVAAAISAVTVTINESNNQTIESAAAAYADADAAFDDSSQDNTVSTFGPDGASFGIRTPSSSLASASRRLLDHSNSNHHESGSRSRTRENSTKSVGAGESLATIEGFDDPDLRIILADDTLLDCKDIVEKLGSESHRQTHHMRLRSAYEWCSSGGEPLYTMAYPTDGNHRGGGVSCRDYLFYTGNSIAVEAICLVPILTQLQGEDPRQQLTVEDSYWSTPHHLIRQCFNHPYFSLKDGSSGAEGRNKSTGGYPDPSSGGDEASSGGIGGSTPSLEDKVREMKSRLRMALKTSRTVGSIPIGRAAAQATSHEPICTENNAKKFFGGTWLPYSHENPYRSHTWLPNDTLCSPHTALIAEFTIVDGALSSEWK